MKNVTNFLKMVETGVNSDLTPQPFPQNIAKIIYYKTAI